MNRPVDGSVVPAPGVLRVLHVEDAEVDHQLACAHLQKAGYVLHALRVETEAELLQALHQSPWDVVLCDYNLPGGFSGLEALELLKRSGTVLPFVLLSGQIGEDTAVRAMRDGASDYLLKNNLARLAPAVKNAIEANRERQARLRADAELAASRQRLAELAQHLQASIELERAAIAREIHDDVGGSLTAVKYDLAWMARHSAPEVQHRVATAIETLDHAIGASQRIMHNLRPAILEQGLVPALQWMAHRFERRNAVPCQFRTSHESIQLPPGVPLVAYRFAQEALTNVSKHARATRVSVDLSLSGGVLSLEVSDNGQGLTEHDLGKARSFGLRGLHQRASTVGGWIDISSSSAGTTLLLSVPLQDAQGYAREHEQEPPARVDREHDPSGWGEL